MNEYVRALLRAGLTNIIPHRPDLYVRPTSSPLGIPSFVMKGRDKPGSKSIYPYPDTQKQFSCDKCGRSYASTGNLKRHKKYECGVEPQFSCPVCQKKFQHRHSVKIHVFSTHRNESGEPLQDGNKDSLPIYPTTDSVPTVSGGSSSWIAQGPPAPPPQQQE
ncbi:Trypsin-1 [Armadillidium vulgare]|nr:Trypsin-1 [Armadillidium vulgare]